MFRSLNATALTQPLGLWLRRVRTWEVFSCTPVITVLPVTGSDSSAVTVPSALVTVRVALLSRQSTPGSWVTW